MRLEQYFKTLGEFLELDRDKTRYFMTDASFKGGWELWLQSEIGYAFSKDQRNKTELIREALYPRSALKCDFLLKRFGGVSDETYVELKCKNSNHTTQEAMNRFNQDIIKTESLIKADSKLNCICIVAVFESYDETAIRTLTRDYDNGVRKAYALDYSGSKARVSRLNDLEAGGNPRPIIIGCALTKIQ